MKKKILLFITILTLLVTITIGYSSWVIVINNESKPITQDIHTLILKNGDITYATYEPLEIDSNVYLPRLAPTNNKAFIGWSLTNSETNAVYGLQSFVTFGHDQTITLYAVWADVPLGFVKITVEVVNNNGTSLNSGYYDFSQVVQESTSFDLFNLNIPNISGYNFMYFNVEPYNGQDLEVNDSIDITGISTRLLTIKAVYSQVQ